MQRGWCGVGLMEAPLWRCWLNGETCYVPSGMMFVFKKQCIRYSMQWLGFQKHGCCFHVWYWTYDGNKSDHFAISWFEFEYLNFCHTVKIIQVIQMFYQMHLEWYRIYDEVDRDCVFKLSSNQLKSLLAVIYCGARFLPALLFCCILQGNSHCSTCMQ